MMKNVQSAFAQPLWSLRRKLSMNTHTTTQSQADESPG
jgi:hypothetical protein